MGAEPVAVHPLVACAEAVEEALKEVAGVDPAFLATRDKADVLLRLHALEGRLTGLRLRVMAAADELAPDRLGHEIVVVVAHVRLHGAAALRRRLDNRDVAEAGQ